MAEIEHFVDPEKKEHHRFDEVRHVKLDLLDREVQLAGKTRTETMSVGEAVEKGFIDNSTLGYFLARIQLFLEIIGVDKSKIRFRQHMQNEMAHYAADCWDAELLTSCKSDGNREFRGRLLTGLSRWLDRVRRVRRSGGV
jgi:glycyl-tRNA synthetase